MDIKVAIETIRKFLHSKYDFDDKDIKSTIDVLCAKGIGNGTYQSYSCLTALLNLLTMFEVI